MEKANNYLNVDSSYIYFYKRSYKGYEKLDINNINFILKNVKIIKKINLSSFGFIGYILILNFILCYKCLDIFELKDKIINLLILLIFIGLYLYNIFIVWKLYLSYRIKNILKKISNPFKDIITKKVFFGIWKCDYIIIIFIEIIDLIIYLIIKFTKNNNDIEKTEPQNYLINFKGINIMEYKLPSYFQSMNKLEKERFLTKHSKEFSYRYSIKHIELIDLINKFRKKKNTSIKI